MAEQDTPAVGGLPRLLEPLRSHLARVKLVHERDLAEGYGEACLPFAPARKAALAKPVSPHGRPHAPPCAAISSGVASRMTPSFLIRSISLSP